MAKDAHTDALTGLLNRNAFEDAAQRALAYAKRHQESFALLSINLDNFSQVNANFGYQYANRVLKETAHRLQSIQRQEDILARFADDEFVIVLVGINEVFDASIVAKKILIALRKPLSIELDNQHNSITASIGISTYPDGGNEITDLLKCANIALVNAKNMGGNSFQYFSHSWPSLKKDAM